VKYRGFRTTFVLLVAVLLLLPGITQAQSQRQRVPDFTLMSNQGKAISLSDYAGKVVLLNFWATWCPYCLEELPELQKLHDELMETGEAVLLLLDQVDGEYETPAVGNAFLEENGFDLVNLYDYGAVSNGIFGVPGYPTTVVIDKEGYLSGFWFGPITYEQAKGLIEEAN
jgi:peroxiredoxin